MKFRPLPGTRLIIALIAAALCWAAWLTHQRTVLRTDDGHMIHLDQSAWPDMRIDINTASAVELTLLPGIGPRLADRIVEDRERNGPFRSLDDLQRVRGVGPMIVQHISEYAIAGDGEDVMTTSPLQPSP